MSERARAARSEEQAGAEDPAIAGIDGLAGMVGTLRSLLEQVAAAAGEQAAAQDNPAQASPDGLSRTVMLGADSARMVFGYTLRMGRDGIDAEPFGNVPPSRPGTTAGPAATTLQPIVEVFEDGDTVVVVAELPGADPESIICHPNGSRLLIEATGKRHYRKELPLPAPVRSEGVQHSFRNGILEVRMIRADPS